jgi:F0F1-type ATP synthase assembly protein I
MEKPNQGPVANRSMFQALGLAWELGYTIAIPLVILAFGGRLLDRTLDTSPWFLLAGVLLSIVASTWLVYRKTKSIVDASAPATGSRNGHSADANKVGMDKTI